MQASICTQAAVEIGESGLCGITPMWNASAIAATFFVCEIPPQMHTSGRTKRQPPASSSSRNWYMLVKRSPVAIGIGIARCTSAIDCTESGRIGSSRK